MKLFLIAFMLLLVTPSFAQETEWKTQIGLNYAYIYDFNTHAKKGAVIAKDCAFLLDMTADGKGTFTFRDLDIGEQYVYNINAVLSPGNNAARCMKLLCSIQSQISLIYIYLEPNEKRIAKVGIADVDTNEGILFYYTGQ